MIRNAASYKTRNKKGAKRVVEEIIAALRREYFKPLSINDYAAQYYMNADYLGRIFKSSS